MTSPRLLAKPTLDGPKAVRVGTVSYNLPRDAQVRFAEGGAIMYALVDSRIHAFTERGEVTIPEDVRRPLARLLFGGGRR